MGWTFDRGQGCTPLISAHGMGGRGRLIRSTDVLHMGRRPRTKPAAPTRLPFPLRWLDGAQVLWFAALPHTFGFGHVELPGLEMSMADVD